MSAARPLALVTAGLRRVGAAIAGALADDGWDLVLHSHTPGEPEAGLAARVAAAGRAMRQVAADLADGAAVAGLIDAATEACGQVPDLLVNNASRFGDDRPESASFDALLGHYAVNCAAPVLLARDLAARRGRGAVIVNILDQRVASPPGDQFAYTLGKCALAAATPILARELAPGARVCAVAPGLTLPSDDYDAAAMARAARLMPLDRLPDPAHVADAVRWLARADAVTGQTLFVDAGAHLRHYPRDFHHLVRSGDAGSSDRPHAPSDDSTNA